MMLASLPARPIARPSASVIAIESEVPVQQSTFKDHGSAELSFVLRCRSLGERCSNGKTCADSEKNMTRRYDHIDLRVPRLAEAAPFYEALLPALGFTRRVSVEGWLQYEAAGRDATEFFGVTESPNHVANENRVAFWAQSASEVDHLAQAAAQAGALNIEGPMQYEPGYYAVFFEDPCGNRLEICHRARE
jgi:predicted enzyme related to lactoylglutathione lyase